MVTVSELFKQMSEFTAERDELKRKLPALQTAAFVDGDLRAFITLAGIRAQIDVLSEIIDGHVAEAERLQSTFGE